MSERYVRAKGIELAYDEFGDLNNPVILLIMSLGTQMIASPEMFCRASDGRDTRQWGSGNRAEENRGADIGDTRQGGSTGAGGG